MNLLNPYVWGAIFIACALSFFGGCQTGAERVQDKWDESVERGKREVARLTAEAGKVTVKVETQFVDRVKVVREKARAIETVREVFVPVDSGSLPGAFRLFYDGAITGTVPDPAGIPDAAPVPVTDVADTHAANIEKCRIAYATVEGWQEWATAQAAVK